MVSLISVGSFVHEDYRDNREKVIDEAYSYWIIDSVII